MAFVPFSNVISQAENQNQDGLSKLEQNKVLLINHLCIVKTMYSYGINSDLDFTERLKYIQLCRDYLKYSNNVFNQSVKSQVSPDIIETFNGIYENYVTLIDKSNSFESSGEEAMRLILFKRLVDLKIERFIKALLCY